MDLGVLYDPKQTLINHIDPKISKAYGMLGFIIRWSKEFSNPHVTKSLYYCFVRPILEYAYYDVHLKKDRINSKEIFAVCRVRDMG